MNNIDFTLSDQKVAFSLAGSDQIAFHIDAGKLGFRIGVGNISGFNVKDEQFDFKTELSYSSGGSVIPSYRGPYVVVPKSYRQGLDTNGLKMLDDVAVEKIPYSRVSNVFGGDTVNIGG